MLSNGIVGFGGVFAGTNPAYTRQEMAHAIRAARISYVVAEPALLPVPIEAAKDVGWVSQNLL